MVIRELDVPSLVEYGSENILLDCDFDYDENEKVQLDIKWYFNSEPTPFYQWVPEKMARPQIIGDKFKTHVDLDHVVHSDSHKRHRALLLKRPTTELSGVYTCKVSSFISEDIRRKRMTVYCKFIFFYFSAKRKTVKKKRCGIRNFHTAIEYLPTCYCFLGTKVMIKCLAAEAIMHYCMCFSFHIILVFTK